jgi:dTDP-4-amino-4,6-dideoxygalactose transaminase
MSKAPADDRLRLSRKMPFVDLNLQRQRIRTEIDRAIARVLEHGQFIMGPEVSEFESQLAAFCGARHAVSCASGTDALLIAMMAKGVRSGNAVLCPAFTYTATPETIALLGASPVFVDVDDTTYNVDPKSLEAGVAAARSNGLEPVGLIAVDLFGQPADYEAIDKVARAHGLWILADAAQSFGAVYRGRNVGTLGDVTATSFFPSKPLGCYGDGGALLTDDDELADVMRSIRLHGKGAEKYDVARLGLNARLDTLQAAILLEKLKIFPDELSKREAVAQRYREGLRDSVKVSVVSRGSRSAWAQFTVRVRGSGRETLVRALAEEGIPTQIHYPRPLHHQPAYAQYPIAIGGVGVAEQLPREVLSLPMHAYLAKEDQERIVRSVSKIVSALG